MPSYLIPPYFQHGYFNSGLIELKVNIADKSTWENNFALTTFGSTAKFGLGINSDNNKLQMERPKYSNLHESDVNVIFMPINLELRLLKANYRIIESFKDKVSWA